MLKNSFCFVAIVTLFMVCGCAESKHESVPLPSMEDALPAPTITTPPKTTVPVDPTRTKTLEPTMISISSSTPTITPTKTQLSDEEIKAWVLEQMINPVCDLPCFWGIIPEQTTMQEARNIFSHLGLFPKFVISEGEKYYYEVDHRLDDGLSIVINILVRDEIVQNLNVSIIPEVYQAGVPRKWLVYSPEMLINEYGLPSQIDFFLGRASPKPTHSMVIYFDAVDIIVEYDGIEIVTSTTPLEICPLSAHVDYIHIWIGKDPEAPPLTGVSLIKATTMTITEFSQLMIEGSKDTCIELIEDAFP